MAHKHTAIVATTSDVGAKKKKKKHKHTAIVATIFYVGAKKKKKKI